MLRLTLRGLLNTKRKEVITMKKYFYTVARHEVIFRVLLIAAIVAVVTTVAAAEPVLAMPDCWFP